MIVPPALPSDGHAEQLEQTGNIFLRLLLEMANMRGQRFHGTGWPAPAPAAGGRLG